MKPGYHQEKIEISLFMLDEMNDEIHDLRSALGLVTDDGSRFRKSTEPDAKWIVDHQLHAKRDHDTWASIRLAVHRAMLADPESDEYELMLAECYKQGKDYDVPRGRFYEMGGGTRRVSP